MSGFDTLRVRIGDAIASHDTTALAAALRSGTHHGKPGVNAATKRWTARAIHERDGANTPELLETALRLASDREPIPRSIACILLADLWRSDREIVLDRAIQLATDLDWEVREWAAGIFGAALDRDFDGEYPTMDTLVVHPEPGVRRAVALAAMRAASAGKPERAGPLIALLERLLTDRDDYVRKNLGPFAIGDGLMRAYPDATIAALATWATRDDETTRWNVAMACGSGAARRYPDRVQPILEEFAGDDRRLVRQAVRTARRRLSPAQ